MSGIFPLALEGAPFFRGGIVLRHAKKIELTSGEQALLEELAIPDPRKDRISFRARIVLGAASGRTNEDIATELDTRRQTISRWRNCYFNSRLPGLLTVKKSLGRRPLSRWRHSSRILDATRNDSPPNGRRWTCRSLAKHLDLSVSLVQRVWKQEGIGSEWRRDYYAAPPFQPGERLRLLGCFFQSGHRAVVVEVLPAESFGKSAKNGEDNLGPPTIVSTLNALPSCREASRTRQIRLLVDQQISFLGEVERQANSGSRLRLITNGENSFSHSRVRRWLSKSGRFSLHYSCVSQDYLADAEARLCTLADQRFSRSLSSNLVALAAQGDQQVVIPPLEAALDFSSITAVFPPLVAAPIP